MFPGFNPGDFLKGPVKGRVSFFFFSHLFCFSGDTGFPQNTVASCFGGIRSWALCVWARFPKKGPGVSRGLFWGFNSGFGDQLWSSFSFPFGFPLFFSEEGFKRGYLSPFGEENPGGFHIKGELEKPRGGKPGISPSCVKVSWVGIPN